MNEPFDVRRERLNRGLSVKAMAAQIGVAGGTLTRLEQGLPVHPSSAKKVADFFDVLATDLIELEAKDAA